MTRPTIVDVARAARVSPATASNVLTGSRATGVASKQRVLDAATALGYRPNALASGLRRKKSRLVGVLVPDVTNVFFAAVVHRLEEKASAAGYEIALITSNEEQAQERSRIQALIARQIDGLVVIPCSDQSLPGSLGQAAQRLPPMVMLDRGFDSPGYDAVAVDNEAGARAAAEHLLGFGHRNIAVLAPRLELANIRERIDGFRHALSAAGCERSERIIVGGTTLEGLRGAIEQELRRSDRPSAIIAMSNVAVLGAVKAIRALDMEMPADISLVGFDDCDWMTVLRPYVTAVAQPIDEMADAAWACLAGRLSGETSTEPAKLRFPCTLRVRESTGRCPISAEVAAA
jgi:LacI family transcriptional regulator